MTWPEDPNVHICGTLDDINRLDEMGSARKKQFVIKRNYPIVRFIKTDDDAICTIILF